MLFRPDLIEKILQGRKTQTRRTWARWRVRVGGVYPVARHMFQPKDDAPCWLLVTERREEPPAAITDQDAVAEGFDGREQFLARWREMHGETGLDESVKVITFVPVPTGFRFHLDETFVPCATCDDLVRLRTLPGNEHCWTHKRGYAAHAAYPRKLLPAQEVIA